MLIVVTIKSRKEYQSKRILRLKIDQNVNHIDSQINIILKDKFLKLLRISV